MSRSFPPKIGNRNGKNKEPTWEVRGVSRCSLKNSTTASASGYMTRGMTWTTIGTAVGLDRVRLTI